MTRLRPALLLAACALALAACGGGSSDPPAASGQSAPAAALNVELVAPQATTLEREISASGSIAAREEIQLGVELSGVRVAAVNVEVGDTVQAGDVLLTLDLRSLEAELKQVEAQVAEADTALRMHQVALKRGMALQPKGLISVNDADVLVANEAQARARLASVKAARDNARLRREFGTLRAPMAGLISARTVEAGQVVGNGAELLRLICNSELEWRAELGERDLIAVREGAAVQLTAPDGSTLAGTVRKIAPALDPRTRLGLVYVDLAEPGPLRAGMFASGRIALGRFEGLTLPLTSVVMRDGRSYVYSVAGDGRVVERAVELGPVRGERVEIRAGIDASARVVGVGAGFLNDGDRVRVVEAGAAGSTPGTVAGGGR